MEDGVNEGVVTVCVSTYTSEWRMQCVWRAGGWCVRSVHWV